MKSESIKIQKSKAATQNADPASTAPTTAAASSSTASIKSTNRISTTAFVPATMNLFNRHL
ncbi:hypothetical protein HK100_008138 [Physocladia obscura]|uniref:Uncharacterized protein n=1 Tax=Physocladia obscura TaxID=109957 RepID=A0AAD5XJT8_9FUNG|nr:hypothetical protein HK100_008138 [Physocladia obscura]